MNVSNVDMHTQIAQAIWYQVSSTEQDVRERTINLVEKYVHGQACQNVRSIIIQSCHNFVY